MPDDLRRLADEARLEDDLDRRADLLQEIAWRDRDSRVALLERLLASDDRDDQLLGADIVSVTPNFGTDREWAKEQGLRAADVEPFTEADRGWLVGLFVRNLDSSDDADLVYAWVQAVGSQELMDARDAVIRHAAHPDSDVRFACAVTLGELGVDDPDAESAVRALLVLARDPVDEVRDWATFALGQWGGAPVDTPEARAVFTENVTHANPEVRAEAIRALAQLGDVEMLQRAFDTYELDLDLVEAARQTGDPRLHQTLLQLLAEETESDDSSDPEVTEYVREVLLAAAEACRSDR
jgi:HEAT repeat protein